MTRSSLAAFIATVALAVPAAWHVLGADVQADGPKVRPDVQVLHLDGADVAMQLDRGALRSGGTISATLVATADTSHTVSVDLETLEDMGYGAERVENPPLSVDRRTIKVQAQPGGGPPVVATIKLGSKRGGRGVMTWFDLYLTPHGAKRPQNRYDSETVAARSGVASWSGNSFGLTIEPPATIPAEGPFTIALRVKNTTKQGFTYCYANVGGTVGGYNEMAGGIQFESDAYDVEAVDDNPPTWSDDGVTAVVPAGAERVMIYRVTPKHPGITHFNIVAHVRSDSGGAMEIATFDRPAPKPADALPSAPIAAR